MKTILLLLGVGIIGYMLLQDNGTDEIKTDEKRQWLMNYYANRFEILKYLDSFTAKEIDVMYVFATEYEKKGLPVADGSNMEKQLTELANKYNFS